MRKELIIDVLESDHGVEPLGILAVVDLEDKRADCQVCVAFIGPAGVERWRELNRKMEAVFSRKSSE